MFNSCAALVWILIQYAFAVWLLLCFSDMLMPSYSILALDIEYIRISVCLCVYWVSAMWHEFIWSLWILNDRNWWYTIAPHSTLTETKSTKKKVCLHLCAFHTRYIHLHILTLLLLCLVRYSWSISLSHLFFFLISVSFVCIFSLLIMLGHLVLKMTLQHMN